MKLAGATPETLAVDTRVGRGCAELVAQTEAVTFTAVATRSGRLSIGTRASGLWSR
jgi:hypothetical protein